MGWWVWGVGGGAGARRITGAPAQLCGSALFKRSSGACWLNAEQEERANTAQLHFYRMLCGKTPLTHTSGWQHGLSYGPGGSAAPACDHCNDLKGQSPQQAQATLAGWTPSPLGNDAFGPQAGLLLVLVVVYYYHTKNVEKRPKTLCKNYELWSFATAVETYMT